MNPALRDRLRKELDEERDVVVRELEELGADPSGTRIRRPDGIDDNFADLAAATAERSEHLALIANARDRLTDIDAAIARMEDGTYGVCEVCGAAIPDARLEARPFSVRCVDCA
jgi:DnaK suppressor protein